MVWINAHYTFSEVKVSDFWNLTHNSLYSSCVCSTSTILTSEFN